MRKKVCIVASYAPSILNFRKELVIEIVKTCDVYVCVPFMTNELKASIEGLGVVVVDIKINSGSINPFDNLIYMFTLLRHFRVIRPDIVFNYTIKPVIWGSVAAKLTGVQHIVSMITGLGYSFTELDSFKRKLVNKSVCILYRGALILTQKVLFQNNDDRQLFKDKHLINNTSATVINGSGVNLDYFKYHAQYPEKITFLMMGRLLKDKGIYEYIQAARHIKALYDNVDFSLVGWIDDNPSSVTASELSTWCKEGVVNFLDKLEDVRGCLMASSVYVLPSYREGTPRSVLEAMSMGRPIITTDAPGCRETVIDGVNGYLVPIKNTEKLVESMIKFIENRELVHTFGKKSRDIAEDKYDVYKVNAVIMKALTLD